MSQNVFEKLDGEKPSLARQLMRNSQVSGTVMAYLNLFCGMANMLGRPLDAVRVDPLLESGNTGTFRARVYFPAFSSSMPRLWAPQSNFYLYAKAKADHLAKALDVNPHLEIFFEDMVNKLNHFCDARSTRLEDIEIIDPIVTRDHIVTFHVRNAIILRVH